MTFVSALSSLGDDKCSIFGCAWAGGLCLDVGDACDSTACRDAYLVAHLHCHKETIQTDCSVFGCAWAGALCLDVGGACDRTVCKDAYDIAHLHCKPSMKPTSKHLSSNLGAAAAYQFSYCQTGSYTGPATFSCSEYANMTVSGPMDDTKCMQVCNATAGPSCGGKVRKWKWMQCSLWVFG